MNPEFEKRHRNGRIWGGLIIVGVGTAFLIKSLNLMPLPGWLFTWPVILILAGIYTLGKNGFQRPGGLVPLTIGAVFLAEKLSPGVRIAHVIWPALIILFGLFVIFSPWRRWGKKKSENWYNPGLKETEVTDEDYINIETIFGGIEKNVVSQNFKGGKISCVFGGAEVNLMQADINGTVHLEINAVFGGVELTVPAGWKVNAEISAFLGGVEDKRPIRDQSVSADKILVLKGSAVFGGVSIKAY